MKITAKAWLEYITGASSISQKAIDLMQAWIDKNGTEDRDKLIEYANALVQHYGQASGALSCKMYEATAEAQGVTVQTAEIAALPEYEAVGKAVNGTLKQSQNVADTVGRLVKQVGADTTLKNGRRDGAEWAWVPHGDTCAFCITLASRGWQKMSWEALKGNHAEHIHANCDCEYAIRFDGKSTVEGYDPDKYLEMYYGAQGSSSEERVKALRRQLYAKKNGLKLDDKGYAIRKSNTIHKKIKNVDSELADLKNEFLKETDGYSYEEWYNDFETIADGFDGDVEDPDCMRLSDIDKKIKAAEQNRRNLLKEKPKRTQLDTGYLGKVPDNELNAFNKKALQQIKEDTGLDENEAKKIQDSLLKYFGGDYEAILSGKSGDLNSISHAIDLMPTYDGSVYRGLTLTREDASALLNMKEGDRIPQKSNISSWSSDFRVANSFGGLSDYERTSIILECDDNITGVGVQHLSKFGTREAEVLSNANYEVIDISIQNKYDYLATHKEYLYFEDDLETMSEELKENVVCKIKVREIS